MEKDPPDDLLVELLVQAERTAARVVGRGQAGDIASEALIRALVRWEKISDHPHPWVIRVATNLAIDVVRRQHLAHAETETGEERPFETDAVERLDIVRALRPLSHRQRQVVVLHYLHGYTDGEVSELLGLSLPTVKTHLGRALKALRRLDVPIREESDASAHPA